MGVDSPQGMCEGRYESAISINKPLSSITALMAHPSFFTEWRMVLLCDPSLPSSSKCSTRTSSSNPATPSPMTWSRTHRRQLSASDHVELARHDVPDAAPHLLLVDTSKCAMEEEDTLLLNEEDGDLVFLFTGIMHVPKIQSKTPIKNMQSLSPVYWYSNFFFVTGSDPKYIFWYRPNWWCNKRFK